MTSAPFRKRQQQKADITRGIFSRNFSAVPQFKSRPAAAEANLPTKPPIHQFAMRDDSILYCHLLPGHYSAA